MAEEEELKLEDLRISCSYSFEQWLIGLGGTVVVSSMNGGLVLIGIWKGKVSILVQPFDRPMGLAVHGKHLILGTKYKIDYFVNAPSLAPRYPHAEHGRYDTIYLPKMSILTGRVNIHDIGWGTDGLWFVNTSYSCLSTVSSEFSFEPRWKPPFITELEPEDRCHLNGLAIRDGQPRYVSCLAESDTKDGWRAHINTGGCLIDTQANEMIARGLAMPHSPRWYNGRLYFLNSAAGELCVMNLENGTYDVICCMPGMTRGLSFVGDTALVGLSMLRSKNYIEMPRRPVQDRFDKLVCGVALVNLKAGKPFGLLQFTAVVGELFDTAFIPGVRQPMLLNMQDTDKIPHAIHMSERGGERGWWLVDDDKKKFAVNPGDALTAAAQPADQAAAPKA